MNWDNDTVRTLISAVSFIVALVAGLYSWFVARNKQTQRQIDELVELNRTLAGRVAVIERDAYHAPGQGDMTVIRDSIGRLHQEISRLDGRLEGVGRAVDIMHQHMMSSGKDER